MTTDQDQPRRSPELLMPQAALTRAADRLAAQYRGIVSTQTVERVVFESYTALRRTARINTHLVTLAGRFAADRLAALAQADGAAAKDVPEVLFVCVHNAGRSQMAAALLARHGAGRVHVRSAGSALTASINPTVIEVMADIGVDLGQEFPKPLTDDVVAAADVVVSMGCGDACPIYPGKRYLDWTADDLAATGMRVLTDTTATAIDVDGHLLVVTGPDGTRRELSYNQLLIGTGATSVRPPITGLDALGPDDGVHLLHSMDDTHAVMHTLTSKNPRTAVIIGAGYIGLEMAEGLTARGIAVTQIEALPQVLPTVDPELGALVQDELQRHGVHVYTDTTVTQIAATGDGRLTVTGRHHDEPVTHTAEMVLVVVGVRPDTTLAAAAGAELGIKNTIVVDEAMRTTLPDIYAAGDCVHTHHRQLGITWLPLGTTAHKQGRVAGENAVGGDARYAGSLGTQVVKVFDLVAARTVLREHEALTADRGWTPVTTASTPDDHKAYYPGATPIHIRITGDQQTGLLLGAQLVGTRGAEIAKRVDTYATALYHQMTIPDLSNLDLSYTPPLGSPWDATQIATQTWSHHHNNR